jgi:hypothetical protein
LRKDLRKLQQKLLGQEIGVNPGLDEDVSEGEEIVAYFHRPVLARTYSLGRAVPTAETSPITEFSLTLRELIVRGRIGRCADQQTQSSWPVLLAPHILTVSELGATEGTDIEQYSFRRRVPTAKQSTSRPDHRPAGNSDRTDGSTTTADEGQGD